MSTKMVTKTCNACHGSGRDPVTGRGNCMLCGGVGRRSEMVLDIPPGPSGSWGKPTKSAAHNRADSTDVSAIASPREGKELVRYQKRLQEGSVISRLSGSVRSYLLANGEFVNTTPGWKVPKLEKIARAEHYERVDRAYGNLWTDVLEQARREPALADLIPEAEDRLRHREAGLFRLPIHKGAFFASSSYEKKGLIGTKTVEIPVRDVKIDEYEKYLRRFIRFGYAWHRPPLKETKEPDALWLINNPLSEIRRSRSRHLGEAYMIAFMLLPQKDAGLIRHVFFP
ncbi:hypothetical protein [Flavimaricola marinus]|uniref:Uncharacterized protein n=1 Tax=Flavimaricola marinus TaxID=1819565 RepID=A0A238LFG9_9RHOB|nr:hypothetical protein [Flavimaricola marinus]SMY08381.1 hypothetical protein LOM8899_02532 [Flavimaricola marinus]